MVRDACILAYRYDLLVGVRVGLEIQDPKLVVADGVGAGEVVGGSGSDAAAANEELAAAAALLAVGVVKP